MPLTYATLVICGSRFDGACASDRQVLKWVGICVGLVMHATVSKARMALPEVSSDYYEIIIDSVKLQSKL